MKYKLLTYNYCQIPSLYHEPVGQLEVNVEANSGVEAIKKALTITARQHASIIKVKL